MKAFILTKKLLIVLSIFFITSNTFAYKKGSYLPRAFGVILGEPTGFSYKSWIDNKTGWDLGLSWSFEGESSVHLHCDYIKHSFNVNDYFIDDLPFYIGLGGRIKFEDKTILSIRNPWGLEYISMIYQLMFLLN